MSPDKLSSETGINPGLVKVREYVDRFRRGALDESELNEENLGAFAPQVVDELINLIPMRYRNNPWPPELVSEMWNPAISADTEVAEAQKIDRILALKAYAIKFKSGGVGTAINLEQNSTFEEVGPVETEVGTVVDNTSSTPENDLGTVLAKDLENITETQANISESVPESATNLEKLVAELSVGKNEAVRQLYQELLTNAQDPEKRTSLVKALLTGTYKQLRESDYAPNPSEETTYAQVLADTTVPSSEQNSWQYRGILDSNSVTRGSFNVNVTHELIKKLDTLIASGKLKANYKFGSPNTPASPQERHDAISIYFLEQPDEAMLQTLSSTIAPYVRGNNLLGHKVAEGFSMSEIGSIADTHIENLIAQIETIDPSFAKAVDLDTAQQTGGHKMSEAQYYALKNTAAAFGYEISYSNQAGFDVSLTENGIETDPESTVLEETPQAALSFASETIPVSTTAPAMPKVEVINEPVQKAERGETVMSFVTAFKKLNSILTQRNREGLTLFFTDNTLRTMKAELANFETIVNQGNPEEITQSLQNIFTLFNQFGQNTERSGQVRDNIQSLREVETTLQSIHNSLGVLYRLYEKENGVSVSDPVLAGMNKVGQRISHAKNGVNERIKIAQSILGS